MRCWGRPAPDGAVSDDGGPAPATATAGVAGALVLAMAVAVVVVVVVVVVVRVAWAPVSNSSMDGSIVPDSSDTFECSWAVRQPEQRDLEMMAPGVVGVVGVVGLLMTKEYSLPLVE